MIAKQGDSILIGNASQRDGPYITCTVAEWAEFLLGAKSGNFGRAE